MIKQTPKVSIDDMEETAKNEDDGCCNKKIRGEWLEVQYRLGPFFYKWGKNWVSREVAENVLKSN